MKARDVPFGVKFITQDWRLLVRNIPSFYGRYINEDLTLNIRPHPHWTLQKAGIVASPAEELKVITVNNACGPDNRFDYVIADEEIRQIIYD